MTTNVYLLATVERQSVTGGELAHPPFEVLSVARRSKHSYVCHALLVGDIINKYLP